MVMTNETTIAQVAAAYEATCNGGVVSTELRCRCPSKHCAHVRTTKRGGGLHRLCTFHQQRANKNQWLVDQRRRARLELKSSLITEDSIVDAPVGLIAPVVLAVLTTLNTLDVDIDVDALCAPMCDGDLEILQSLFFDEDDGCLSDDFSDLSDALILDTSIDWIF